MKGRGDICSVACIHGLGMKVHEGKGDHLQSEVRMRVIYSSVCKGARRIF